MGQVNAVGPTSIEGSFSSLGLGLSLRQMTGDECPTFYHLADIFL